MNRKAVLSVSFVIICFIIFFAGCTKPEEGKGKLVEIGAILPLTGDAALYGEVVKNAIDLAVEKVNKDGGIKGMQLAVIYEDSQAKADLAVNACNKLINIDKVAAIVGAMASSEVQAIAPILNKRKVVLISPAATSRTITDSGDYIFRTIVSDIYDGTSMARFASNERGIKSASVFFITEAGPQGVAEAFMSEFKGLGGTVVQVEKCNRGDKDFKSQISKLNQDESEALYFALYPRETELFIRQAKEIGIQKLFMTHQLIDDPEILSKVGDAANGIFFTSPKLIPEVGGKTVEAFFTKYREKYGKEPPNFTPNAYDAVKILALTMQKYGFETEAIKNGLYEIKDYKGASGTISIDKNGDVEQKMLIMVIKNGKPELYK